MQFVRLFMVSSMCVVAGRCFTPYTPTQQSFRLHKIVPDIIPVGPPNQLRVLYPSGVMLTIGAKTKPYYIDEQPSIVEYRCPKISFNLLIMIDFDEPAFGHYRERERVHWLVVNMEADDVSSGQTLIEYGMFPVMFEGPHRYAFLMYQQPWVFGFDIPYIDAETIEGRNNFSIADFSTKYHLNNPLWGAIWINTF
uniref:OV-16 antigen n=1 Tax=Sipha flava TaxID=143950 RepID=A0A2S2QS10_9HEMI